MKVLTNLGAILAFSVLMFADVAEAQERRSQVRASPNASVSQDIGTTKVSITYGRPGVKGRDVRALVNDDPNGEVWRTGANEPTIITFSSDVMVGGEEIPAGTYSLFTIPGETWTFIINSKTEGWGTQYDSSMDVARIQATRTVNAPYDAEWFTIYFTDLSDTKALLNLHWGSILTSVPVIVPSGE